MFERYTERARRVIFFARDQASQFGSTTIESEHLLLGLIQEDKNIAKRFAPQFPSVEGVRDAIAARITIREKISTSDDLPLSQECQRILAFAREEADDLTHRHAGTEHLLMGILREESCLAARFLTEHGLRLDAIRERLSRSSAPPDGDMPILIDALTGLYNFRFLNDYLSREISRAERHHHALALLLIDVDNFRRVIETHGESVGDKTLKALGRILQQSFRREDLAFRRQASEFALVLPDTDLQGALHVAEKVRIRVETSGLPAAWSGVTLSIGVTQFEPKLTLERLMHRAEKALHKAKRDGGNRVEPYTA